MSEDLEAIIVDVKAIAEPMISNAGMELVDLELVGGRGNYILRVLIEKPEKVSLDDCVFISRELSDLLDIEDPIPYRYTLEVSSPGIDRPFKTVRDYERAYGDMIRITTSFPVDDAVTHVGRLEHLKDGIVTLMIGKKAREIPFDAVQKALRELIW